MRRLVKARVAEVEQRIERLKKRSYRDRNKDHQVNVGAGGSGARPAAEKQQSESLRAVR